MPSMGDIVARMIAVLGITDPDLDTSVGSTTRKILDVTAEAAAGVSVDQHLLAYQYDIDSKIEGDLDDFVQLFGLSRLAPKRATGTVTFYRGPGEAFEPVQIPVGTQIASDTQPPYFVSTVTPAVMNQGVLSVDVPVQAVQAGPQGNIGAGSLTIVRTPVDGVLTVTNVNPLSGGTSAETDSELRARWKRTVFRSLAGTTPMFEGIALNDEHCSAVNVVGANKTYREQIQIRGGQGTSSVDDVEFIYADSVVLGPFVDESLIFLRDYDYFFDTRSRPPKVIMNVTDYPTGQYDAEDNEIRQPVEGEVLDLIFEYAPRDSRNLPSQGITNRVDLWVSGVRAEQAVQSVAFQTNKRFVPDVASPYYYRKFVRKNHDHPALNNVFIPLAFGPIITVPSSLTMGGETYYENVDYWLVHDDTPFGLTPRSLFGLEWAQGNQPPANLTFQVGGNTNAGGSYTFNAVPRDIQGGIDRWRLVGIDAQVHQAKLQQLRFNLAIMYARNATPEVVNQQINEALARFVNSLGFDSTVQVSDALRAVSNVSGVDNVRFLEAADWPTYRKTDPNAFGVGIQRVVEGEVVQSFVDAERGTPRDVTFGDSELPVFESIRGDKIDPATGKPPAGLPSVRAQNTFFPIIGSTWSPGASTDAPVLVGSGPASNYVLTWSAVPGALGYTLYFNGTRFASFGPANGSGVALTYTTNANQLFDYTVKAYMAYDDTGVDNAVYGPASNTVRPASLT